MQKKVQAVSQRLLSKFFQEKPENWSIQNKD
jgi:hypothetical protein